MDPLRIGAWRAGSVRKRTRLQIFSHEGAGARTLVKFRGGDKDFAHTGCENAKKICVSNDVANRRIEAIRECSRRGNRLLITKMIGIAVLQKGQRTSIQ